MIDQARKLMATFRQLDPAGGCWQFIQKHKPELWRQHCQAIRESDLTRAATTFKAMLQAWENRHHAEQGALL